MKQNNIKEAVEKILDDLYISEHFISVGECENRIFGIDKATEELTTLIDKIREEAYKSGYTQASIEYTKDEPTVREKP